MFSMYIFPTGLGAWTLFTITIAICLFSALKAINLDTLERPLPAATATSICIFSLSFLFICLDLPILAAAQFFLVACPASLILICAAKISYHSPTFHIDTNAKRKRHKIAAALAGIFFFLNVGAVLMSPQVFEQQFTSSKIKVVFANTEYAFIWGDYASLENLTALALSIYQCYPYLAALLLVSISTMIISALKIINQNQTTLINTAESETN